MFLPRNAEFGPSPSGNTIPRRHCEWLDGAIGPAVGARFKGTNQHGFARWSTKPRVVVADPGTESAFVTESFEMFSDMPWYFRVADRLLMHVTDRKADLDANMVETLVRLKSTTEPLPASS